MDWKELYKKIKPYLVYIFALIGGGLMPFAFAPYNYRIAAIASPILLLWCLEGRKPFGAFLIGWCYGIAMFGLGTSWVYVSIHDYGYTSPLVAALITALFILYIALFPAVMSALFNQFFKENTYIRTLLVFPALWVVFEMLRGWLLTGFPWLFVGYSQITNQLRSFGPLGSVWAVSWAAVLTSSFLFCLIDYYFKNKQNPSLRNKLFGGLIVLWLSAFGLHNLNWTLPTETKVNVALVQGNIAQLMRWDPQYINQIVGTYERLTQQALNANVVIWPEGAIPIPLPISKPFFQRIGELAKSHNFTLISGVPTQRADQVHYLNSLLAVGLAGPNDAGCENYEQPGCIYFKEHLVPFGEYVPLEKYLRGLIAFLNLPMSSFEAGSSRQSPILAQGLRFAPAICYEIAYPIFVQHMSKNADFILTVSNDTWFGTSIGPAQHLQIARFRALETGKNVIRATNTGLTAIINPDAKIQAIAPSFQEAVLNGTVTVMVGETPWVRYGIWPLAALLALALVGGFFWLRRHH